LPFNKIILQNIKLLAITEVADEWACLLVCERKALIFSPF